MPFLFVWMSFKTYHPRASSHCITFFCKAASDIVEQFSTLLAKVLILDRHVGEELLHQGDVALLTEGVPFHDGDPISELLAVLGVLRGLHPGGLLEVGVNLLDYVHLCRFGR